MKVILDLPPDVIDDISEVIETDGYAGVQDFVTTALMNQVLLEQEGTLDGVTSLTTAVKARREASEPLSDPADGWQARQQLSIERAPAGQFQTQSLLSLENADNIRVVDPPAWSRLDSGPLWGQYNRIFPIKLVVRGLASALQRGDATTQNDTAQEQAHTWCLLEQFATRMSREARQFGQQLEHIDTERNRRRGDQLATGLPTGDDPVKSMERFQTHFLGYIEQSGDLSGGAPRLRLVDIQHDGAYRIGLTKAGLDFAALGNPLLDDDIANDQALTDEERAWYLDYVETSLPDEYDAICLVTTAIAEGDDRPESLTQRIATLDETWSEAQASTIRSGLVGRMRELGLVDSTRVGQRGVKYVLTEAGEQL